MKRLSVLIISVMVLLHNFQSVNGQYTSQEVNCVAAMQDVYQHLVEMESLLISQSPQTLQFEALVQRATELVTPCENFHHGWDGYWFIDQLRALLNSLPYSTSDSALSYVRLVRANMIQCGFWPHVAQPFEHAEEITAKNASRLQFVSVFNAEILSEDSEQLFGARDGTWVAYEDWHTVEPQIVEASPSFLDRHIGRGVVSPNGRYLAVHNEDSLSVYDLESHTSLLVKRQVHSFAWLRRLMAWTPDSRELVFIRYNPTWNGENQIMAMDLEGQERILLSYPDQSYEDLAWSPDREWLLSATGGQLLLWRQDLQAPTDLGSPASAVSWSVDSRMFAVTTGRDIAIWDIATQTIVKRFSEGYWQSIAWSPNGELIAVANYSYTAVLDAETGEELARMPIYTSHWPLGILEWSHDGKYLIYHGEHAMFVWGVESRHIPPVPILPVVGHIDYITPTTSDTSFHALQHPMPQLTPITVESIQSLKTLTSLTSSQRFDHLLPEPVSYAYERTAAYILSPDGLTYVFVPNVLYENGNQKMLIPSRTLTIVDTATGRPITNYTSPQRIENVAWSADSKNIVFATGQATQIWDLTLGSGIYGCGANSPYYRWITNDQEIAVSYSWRGDHILNPLTGEIKEQLDITYEEGVWAWSQNGQIAYMGSRFGGLEIYDRQTNGRMPIAQTDDIDPSSAFLAPDEKHTLVRARDGFNLVEIATGQITTTYPLEEPYIGAIAWSPDQSLLAFADSIYDLDSGETRGEIVIWNAHTGDWLRKLWHPAKDVQALRWSADQTRLLAQFEDGTIWIWAVGES